MAKIKEEFELPKREEVWVNSKGKGDRDLENLIYNTLNDMFSEYTHKQLPICFLLDNKKQIHELLGMLIEYEESK